MTKKAQDIGEINSHFANPHGLTAPDHYSTVRDLAIVFRYAMKNSTFREIVQTKFSSVSTTAVVRKKVVPRRMSVRNHNRLLWGFDGAIGGKTGYTFAAQKCFVGGVSRDGATLIVSILGSRDLWGDVRRLLEYGLDNYETLKVASPIAPAFLNEKVPARSSKSTPALLSPQEQSRIQSPNGFVLQITSVRERERAELL